MQMLGFAIKGRSTDGYHIFETTDGGRNWNIKLEQNDIILNDLCFVGNRLWAVGVRYNGNSYDAPVIKVKEIGSGDDWQDIDIQQDKIAAIHLFKVHFIDENNGWIIGSGNYSSDALYRPIILATLDGGQNWNLIALQADSNIDNFRISPGRIYVSGMLCENEQEASYLNQPSYHTDRPLVPPVSSGPPRKDLVYLDVWERHVTIMEDPSIGEIALGGGDTTTRVQTVWQVKVKEKIQYDESSNTRVFGLPAIKGWPPNSSGGRLSTSLPAKTPSNDPCAPRESVGYWGIENRLYRVEIHTGGSLNDATLKWSHDNGAIAVAVEQFLPPKRLIVKSLGRDNTLALRRGDWVEVLDDKNELNGEPGILACIDELDESGREITLSKDITEIARRGSVNLWRPKIRRWDQGKDAIRITGAPVELEYGIEVHFSGSNFRSGDYWVFTARAATGEIERLTSAPPKGIEHYYCPLALISWQSAQYHGLWAAIQDCRPKFKSLAAQGTHIRNILATHMYWWRGNKKVTKFPLRNDVRILVDDFVNGIEFVCDRIIDKDTIRDQHTLTVIARIPINFTENYNTWHTVGYKMVSLCGVVSVKGNVISWKPTVPPEWFKRVLLKSNAWDNYYPEIRRYIPIHVVLKGNFIWSGRDVPRLNLDGDTFGKWHAGCNNLDLRLPSGNGAKGGDFEMWFCLIDAYPESNPEYDTGAGIGCDQL